jgi:murein DD-endopeptidase MepM/ murein hydrolase activator NlpD
MNKMQQKTLVILIEFLNNNLLERVYIFGLVLIIYIIPVPQGTLQLIDKPTSPAHTGKLRNAVDLIVPQNTPVLAAADGIVTFVKDDSNVGGPDPSYWHNTNFISIMHFYREYT